MAGVAFLEDIRNFDLVGNFPVGSSHDNDCTNFSFAVQAGSGRFRRVRSSMMQ